RGALRCPTGARHRTMRLVPGALLEEGTGTSHRKRLIGNLTGAPDVVGFSVWAIDGVDRRAARTLRRRHVTLSYQNLGGLHYRRFLARYAVADLPFGAIGGAGVGFQITADPLHEHRRPERSRLATVGRRLEFDVNA